MRVVLTGADGYLGCLMGAELVRAGHEVSGLDAGFYRAGWLYSGVDSVPGVLTRDIRRVTVADFEGADAVVHLAELSNDPLGALLPDTTYAVNHIGSTHLASTAKAAGVTRFVYASSCSVYGAAEQDWVDETSPVAPQTAYAECKVLVEQELRRLADDDFSPVALRNATAFGASPRMRFDIVLNNLAGLAHTTGTIAMTSDGTPWRPLVHALDIARAVSSALAAPREVVHGEVFNIGSDAQNLRVRDIAETVAAVFPGCELTFGDGGGDLRSYRVSFAKAADLLPGFTCAWDVARGARQLKAVFDHVQLDAGTFTGRSHTRLLQLQHLLATGQVDDDLFWRPPGDVA